MGVHDGTNSAGHNRERNREGDEQVIVVRDGPCEFFIAKYQDLNRQTGQTGQIEKKRGAVIL